MKGITNAIWGLTLVLVVSIVAVGVAGRLTGARAMSAVPSSGNVAALPERWDVRVQELPEAQLPAAASGAPLVSARQAVRVAESEFGLSDAQLDTHAGAVRAYVALHTRPAIKAWIVPMNVLFPGGGPAGRHVIYRKLCIVVNAATGQYVFAYTGDPEVVH